MLHTLAAEFPHVAVFYIGGDLICIASNEPLIGDPARYRSFFAVQRVRDSLSRIGMRGTYDLLYGSPLIFGVSKNIPHPGPAQNI